MIMVAEALTKNPADMVALLFVINANAAGTDISMIACAHKGPNCLTPVTGMRHIALNYPTVQL